MKSKLVIGAVAGLGVLAAAAFGAERYAQGRAAELVEAMLARPPVAKATHGAIRYSLWRGRIDIDDVTVEKAQDVVHRLEAAHIGIDGIGLFALARQGQGGLRADAIEFDQFSMSGDDGQRSIRRLVMTAPHLEPEGAAPAGTPESAGLPESIAILARFSAKSLVGEGIAFSGPGVDSSADRWSFEDIVKGRVGVFTASGLKSHITLPPDRGAEDGAAGREVRIEAAEARLKDIDLPAAYAAAEAMQTGQPFALTYGEGSLSKLTIAEAGNGSTVTVDSIVIDGVRVHGAGFKLPDPAAGERISPPAAEDLRNVALALAVDRLSIAGVTVTAPDGSSGRAAVLELQGLAADIQDLANRAPKFFVGHVRLGDVAAHTPNGISASIGEINAATSGTLDQPTGGDFEIKTVTVPAAIAPIFGSLGYKKVSIDLAGRTIVDRAQGAIDGTITLKAADAGALELAVRASNCPIDLSLADAGTDAIMARWREAKLERAQLHYEDASLADRLFRYSGALAGQDAAAARQQILDLAVAQRAAYEGMPTLARALDGVIAFLRKPGSLTIAAEPPQPVALADLVNAARDPEAAAVRLGLTVQ